MPCDLFALITHLFAVESSSQDIAQSVLFGKMCYYTLDGIVRFVAYSDCGVDSSIELIMPRHKECNCHNLLADDETWLAFLEPVLCKDPSAVQSLAHLLFIIKEAIDSGPDGVKRASDTLLDGRSEE